MPALLLIDTNVLGIGSMRQYRYRDLSHGGMATGAILGIVEKLAELVASHPGHDALGAFASGFGGMVSIELEGGFERSATLLDNLQLFVQAVSLGDLESLACHPASTTHAAMDEASRLAAGVNDDLIRFSIGVEDADDLIEDLKRALKAAEKAA